MSMCDVNDEPDEWDEQETKNDGTNVVIIMRDKKLPKKKFLFLKR